MTDPKCVFCKKGSLDILHETENFWLVQAVRRGEVMPGAFLAIAKKHIGPTEGVDFNPHNEVVALCIALEMSGQATQIDNVALNRTRAGGTQVPSHMHYWLIDREPVRHDLLRRSVGQPPSLGLYGLLEEAARANPI